MFRLIWAILCIVVFGSHVLANNVKIKGEVKLQALNGTTAVIYFPLSWEHSWRGGGNWDAVWIFVKYKRKGVNEPWHHAYLKESGHRVSGSASLPAMEFFPVYSVQNWVQQEDVIHLGNNAPNTTGTNKKVVPGLFLFRKKNGSGNIDIPRVSLEWNFNEGDLNLYTQLTQQDIIDGKIEMAVQAIEMVHVPMGPYYLGDVSSTYSFINAEADGAMYVTTDSTQMLYRMSLTSNTAYDEQWEVPENYPMGYTGYYMMKYEVSQEQYVNFLNHLTLRDQQKRIQNSLLDLEEGNYAFGVSGDLESPSSRNGIIVTEKPEDDAKPYVFGFDLAQGSPFNSADDGKSLPCNFLSPADMNAYLDWIGLRPLAEPEYEKACRERSPVSYYTNYSYAWETPNYTPSTMQNVQNAGKENESVVNSGNVNGGSADATYYKMPMRCGIFATETSDMISAGASCWGVMELTGNLNEIYYNAEGGRIFNGEVFGDGNIWSTPVTWKDTVVTFSGTFTAIHYHSYWTCYRYVVATWTYTYPDVLTKKGNPVTIKIHHWQKVANYDGQHYISVNYTIPKPVFSWPAESNMFALRGGSFESDADQMTVSYRGDKEYYSDKDLGVDTRGSAIGFRGGRSVPTRVLGAGMITGENGMHRDTMIACSENPYQILEYSSGEEDSTATIYTWEINDGSGWKEIAGKYGRQLTIDWVVNDSLPWHEYAFRRHSVAAHAEGYTNEVVLRIAGYTSYTKSDLLMEYEYEYYNISFVLEEAGDIKVEWLKEDAASGTGSWQVLHDYSQVTGTQTCRLTREDFEEVIPYGDGGQIEIRTTVDIGGCSLQKEYTLTMEHYAYSLVDEEFADSRDGKTYQVKSLEGGLAVMLDDLDYDVNALSSDLYEDATDGNYTVDHVYAEESGDLQLCPDGYHVPTVAEMEYLLYSYWAASSEQFDGEYPYYEENYTFYGPPLLDFVAAFFGYTGGSLDDLTSDITDKRYWAKDDGMEPVLYEFYDSGWGWEFMQQSDITDWSLYTGKIRCVKDAETTSSKE